jgi:hypothetical protein
MLALIGTRSTGWTKTPSAITVRPSLRSVAAAIGWGLTIAACTMVAQAVAVLGSLYAAGVVSL